MDSPGNDLEGIAGQVSSGIFLQRVRKNRRRRRRRRRKKRKRKRKRSKKSRETNNISSGSEARRRQYIESMKYETEDKQRAAKHQSMHA